MDQSAGGKGEFMEGLAQETGRNGRKNLVEDGIEKEEALAKEDAQDEGKVFARAQELESAITALLQLHTPDPNQQFLANQWLSQFVTQPFAWTAALYIAFPPAHSGLGTSMEVRYFTLNILLGKIRSDWIQLGTEDALEMYETLLRQVPSNLENPWFASRLLVLVSAASVVAGEQAALQLVQNVLGAKPIVDGPFATELLTALAEEIFVSSWAHSVEVVESMRDISPDVVQFLDDSIKDVPNSQGEAKIFTCLERWINAGFTLSELYSTYPNLLKALFRALGSQDDGCFDAAVSTLSEFVAAVDLLPDREAAIRVTISAILSQQGLYAAAASPGLTQSLLSRSRGLVILITVVASSEASLLARGGIEASSLLDWLVDATGGGGGLHIEGATIAAVAWPRLAAVPAAKHADILQASRFAAAAQAVLQAEKYPADSENWETSCLEEDELLRYREGAASDALAAVYGQLGTSLLSHLLVHLQGAVTWQPAEVCLFTMAILSCQIKASAGLSGFQAKLASSEGEQVAARSFLSAVFVWVSASTPANEKDLTNWKSLRLVQTTLLVVEKFAEWTAIDLRSLEAGMKYAMGTLKIHNVRGNAAKALGEICRVAAPHIIAAQALGPVFGAYELALSTSDRLEANERIAFVQGLAVISSALPPVDAEAAVNSLTGTAISTIKALAEMRAPSTINGQALSEELRVLAAVVTYGTKEGTNPALHPALTILHGIWPSLDVVAGHWAGDADVVTALCELWGTIASRLGIVLSAVLPSVIKSATAMYKQHLVAACLDCLSNIVLLASSNTNITPEVDEYLLATLIEVTNTLKTLEQIVKDARSRRGPDWKHQIGKEVEQEDIQQQNAEAALCSISKLARSFLHSKPYIFLASPAFERVFQSVIGSIERRQVESSLAGAKLLSEIILCLSFSDDDFKGKVTWQLPADLVSHIDQMVGLYGARVVEVVLRTLAESQLVEPLRNALADVLMVSACDILARQKLLWRLL